MRVYARAFVVALAFFTALGLHALDLKKGRMKISIFEDSGRFNVYYLKDVAKGQYLPLLFDQDTRTSSINLFVNNRVYRVGESSEYRTSVRALGDGAELVFKSAVAQLTVGFGFEEGIADGSTEAVRIRLSVQNLSELDIQAGIKIVLDTYMAEKSGIHFSTDLRKKVVNESAFGPAQKDQWILSPYPDDEGLGCLLDLSDQTSQADSVILANWSRLNASGLNFDFNQTRNFTLQPYSINDSAIGVFYASGPIARGKSREYALVLGNRQYAEGRKAIKPLEASKPEEEKGEKTNDDAKVIRTRMEVQTDLVAVRDLIEKINAQIESGESLSADQMLSLRGILERLKQRKYSY